MSWWPTPSGTLAHLDQRRRRLDPWIAVAERVLKGHFDKCSNSVLQSLYIGMRKSREKECVEAVTRLVGHKDFSNVPEFVFRVDPKKRL